jgi:ribosomal protein RSM22 (predicted rRNA methylase)
MRLPSELLAAIQQETEKIDRRQLAQAAAQLTEHYQSADFSSPAITSDAHRAAYLAVRFPATYAAVRRALSEIRLAEINARAPQVEINSLLDLGAGPGTVLFAASEEFALQQATLIEVDPNWIALAKRLAAQTSLPIAKNAQWLRQDLRSNDLRSNDPRSNDLRSSLSSTPHDLVVISYTLGELPKAAADSVLRKAWSCAGKFLVIIEPGTMRGFAAVNTARSMLIANAARIIAPCPHHHACPMAAANDWCHFAQRVERTSQHRQLKGGTLGYEDEKFSYLIAAKPGALPALAAGSEANFSRIERHPLKHSGYVQLSLCTPQGQIKNQTVTRSSKAAYKSARQSEWGDAWTE